ncbi:toxin YjjJ [Ditylenchus destructor]|nr:toxin YjjJ [Ditylenchus destructor]
MRHHAQGTCAARGSSLPIFEIDPTGNLRDVARLDLVHPEGSAMRYLDAFAWPMDISMRDGWFEGLPYPMQDMRPQGFLGRNLAKYYAPVLQVGNDPTAWSDDDALHVMTLLGDDTPGNLLVGEPACRRWLDRRRRITAQGPEAVPDDALDSAFPAKASLVMMDGLPDSSAGGNSPQVHGSPPAVRRHAPARDREVLRLGRRARNAPLGRPPHLRAPGRPHPERASRHPRRRLTHPPARRPHLPGGRSIRPPRRSGAIATGLLVHPKRDDGRQRRPTLA